MSRRRDILSWSHHRTAADFSALSDEEEDQFLDQAVKEGWSKGRLREEIRRYLLVEKRDPSAFPDGTFAVIYADPPWQYDNSGFDEAAESQYPTMPPDFRAGTKIYIHRRHLNESQRARVAACLCFLRANAFCNLEDFFLAAGHKFPLFFWGQLSHRSCGRNRNSPRINGFNEFWRAFIYDFFCLLIGARITKPGFLGCDIPGFCPWLNLWKIFHKSQVRPLPFREKEQTSLTTLTKLKEEETVTV
jgi:hypothetical protein